MSENIRWEDPVPVSGGRRGRVSKIFPPELQEALKSNPGKWAVVVPEANSSAISNAQSWARRREGFKVTSRTIHDKTTTETPYRVYAMYDPSMVGSDDSVESDD